jgi:hypothetical protein
VFQPTCLVMFAAAYLCFDQDRGGEKDVLPVEPCR